LYKGGDAVYTKDVAKNLRECASRIKHAAQINEWNMLERRAAIQPEYYGCSLLEHEARAADSTMRNKIEDEIAAIDRVIKKLEVGDGEDAGAKLGLDTSDLRRIVTRLEEYANALEVQYSERHLNS